MNQILGIIQNGKVVLDSQVDWPDGARIVVASTGASPLGMKNVRDASLDKLEQLADELADELDASLGANRKPLSDCAISREGIYREHP